MITVVLYSTRVRTYTVYSVPGTVYSTDVPYVWQTFIYLHTYFKKLQGAANFDILIILYGGCLLRRPSQTSARVQSPARNTRIMRRKFRQGRWCPIQWSRTRKRFSPFRDAFIIKVYTYCSRWTGFNPNRGLASWPHPLYTVYYIYYIYYYYTNTYGGAAASEDICSRDSDAKFHE